MIDLSTLRAISMFVWLCVAAGGLPSMSRVLRGKAQFFDVLWSLIGFFGLDVAGFNLRWFIGGDTTVFWGALYIFSALLGVTSLKVMAQYQRANDHGR